MEHVHAHRRLNVTRSELKEFLIVCGVAAMILLDISRLDSSVYNNYVRLAQAFLEGHAWIKWPGPYIDAVDFGGRRYVIEGPVPAILLGPLVALFGLHANQTAFACITCAIAAGAAWLVARRLGAGIAISVATTSFFVFGTPLAWCGMYGAVWYVAHTTAVMFATLAVMEVLGKRRAWLIALFVVLAAGSRFTCILALLPLLPFAVATQERSRRIPALGALVAVLVPAAALYVAYNKIRWGVPNDVGYVMWYHQDAIGETTGSPFRIEYFPYELTAFFATFPAVVSTYPWVKPAYGAVSIEVTSPALVLAFFAWTRWPLVLTMWLTAALVAGPSFLYYANGGAQWGMRHMLDFVPFLMPMMVLGARKLWPWVTYLLCGVSVLIGFWGLWYWRTFYDSFLVHKAYGM